MTPPLRVRDADRPARSPHLWRGALVLLKLGSCMTVPMLLACGLAGLSIVFEVEPGGALHWLVFGLLGIAMLLACCFAWKLLHLPLLGRLALSPALASFAFILGLLCAENFLLVLFGGQFRYDEAFRSTVVAAVAEGSGREQLRLAYGLVVYTLSAVGLQQEVGFMAATGISAHLVRVASWLPAALLVKEIGSRVRRRESPDHPGAEASPTPEPGPIRRVA